ncbi:MAG: peptidoglycan DD-metalloendopeptidase family protein [Proteobacteria bacterium]|nr:peptidoglycan DD-metalloendopeptidase family protein [Pseudomonadota bacterium]
MQKVKLNITRAGVAKVSIGLLVLALIAVIAAVLVRRNSEPGAAAPHETQVTVASGDTLSKLLAAENIPGRDINAIAEILKKECGVSGLRADADSLVMSREHENAPIDKITLSSGPWKRVELTCADGQWTAKNIDIDRDTRLVRRVGTIADGESFYMAGRDAGIPDSVIMNVFDLLAFEIDFERDVRAGQEFSVVYEENYNGADYVNAGNVVAVSFDSLRGDVQMYRFRKPDGTIGYYDQNGNSAIKSLKRTPINNAKISSNFNLNRKHPVLGYSRAHKGVDFRAGSGTPIPAAGAGTVVERKYNSGYGNYITIKHNGTYSTRYGHMSSFNPKVRLGTRVSMGQIIGYVGSTGLSTGPHLHYEIIQNGIQVNPMTVKLPAIDNLDNASKQKFLAFRAKLDEAIDVLRNNPNLFVQM